MKSEEIDSLARATMAHGLLQLALHFPDLLDELNLTIVGALERALVLAEEAISQAPNLPDGYVALGRLLLCHDDPDALAEARDILEHALKLDPEHDASLIAVATVLRESGDRSKALQHTESVIRRGNGQPQPLVLRALLHLDNDDAVAARRDLERAVQIAPDAGLFLIDAAFAASKDGDDAAALNLHNRSRELLGRAFTATAKALALQRTSVDENGQT
ncbi:MAG: hypothetical protein A2341_00645 [Deltaproteobacteria bacterium RIFOXYB12_FULL_58_9]|nr:MAG: hypothetical protein A2341_00645 [Deltaproteobacteria bacterium RIFOXYB12_FULL_58_9]